MYSVDPMSSYAGAGLILLTPDFRVLLVQDAKTLKWGFPKGHREDSDQNDLHTAMREVEEETGITSASYIVQEPAFRITKGSSSYIFRYAILHNQNHGTVQNQKEISRMQWIPIVDLMQSPDSLDGNKYMRTWISNLRTFAPRRDTQQLAKVILSLNPPSYLYL
jgi:8-oxo-dGTP pyrophosphatase MutT (NUDIX family)